MYEAEANKAFQKTDVDKVATCPTTSADDKNDTVFVLPFFAKPGKHNYMIKWKDTNSHD